jgi:hypothetical protein
MSAPFELRYDPLFQQHRITKYKETPLHDGIANTLVSVVGNKAQK